MCDCEEERTNHAALSIRGTGGSRDIVMGEECTLTATVVIDEENIPDDAVITLCFIGCGGIEVTPDWVQQIKPAPEVSTTFQVKFLNPGRMEVRVAFYYNRRWLGMANLDVNVLRPFPDPNAAIPVNEMRIVPGKKDTSGHSYLSVFVDDISGQKRAYHLPLRKFLMLDTERQDTISDLLPSLIRNYGLFESSAIPRQGEMASVIIFRLQSFTEAQIKELLENIFVRIQTVRGSYQVENTWIREDLRTPKKGIKN